MAGPELYQGVNHQEVKHHLLSEKQVDPDTIEDAALVNYPDKLTKVGQYAWMYDDCDMRKIDVTVRSINYRGSDQGPVKQGIHLDKKNCRWFTNNYPLMK